MGRQAFLPTHKGKPWSFGPNSASQRPNILQLIGDCIAIWPFIENDLALGLAGLLHANTTPALSLFSSLRTSRLQREAIQAAASATLDEIEMELLSAVFVVINSAETARNDLAHGLWGLCDPLSDCLLWVEGKHMGPWNAEMVLRERDEDPPSHRDLEKRIFVYREKDLVEIKAQLMAARHISFGLAMLLLWVPGRSGTREKIRLQLSNEPEILKVLRHKRAGTGKP